MPLPNLHLARLRVDGPIITPDGTPTGSFVRWLNDNLSNLEQAINAQSGEINLIETALTNAGIALDTAQQTARANKIATSSTNPGSILTAEVSVADTTKAKIKILDHTRIYGDSTTVSVTGGSIDLLDQASIYYVYYDDPTLAGGAVTYHAVDTDQGALTPYQFAAQTGTGTFPDRLTVGSVATPPTSSSPPVAGGGPRPPGTGGYGGGELSTF